MEFKDGNSGNSNTNRTVSFSLFTIGLILSIVFMILKLCGVIGWAWIFVWLPVIIAVGIDVLVFVAIIIIAIILASLNNQLT